MSDRLIGNEGDQAVTPALIPACMEILVQGYEWTRKTVGKAGGAVYRLGRRGDSSLYLKCGLGTVARDITDEMVRLRWLAGRTLVPEVLHFVASGNEAWLLMTELPGRTAYQELKESGADRIAIVDALVSFLLHFHGLPIEVCPFNSDHHLRLIQAHDRLVAGLIDSDDFDNEHTGWTASQVWNQTIGMLPITSDSVVTHGDLSLDNILMEGGKVIGVIDVARVGIADRYQDLAILSNCIGEFDDTLRHRLFTRYGIAKPDERKLRFHLMLDECF
jgi:aminoglycoside 3'-phosphotransferase-1